jgi:hypothetical protein
VSARAAKTAAESSRAWSMGEDNRKSYQLSAIREYGEPPTANGW